MYQETNWIEKQIKHTIYVSAKSKTHEAHLKKHQKKYASLDCCSSYIGGGGGIFDYFEEFEKCGNDSDDGDLHNDEE